MGALVPFPTLRPQGEAVGVRVPPEGSAKVIILPVVQYVRSGAATLAPGAVVVHDPR